jgi:hypothetical protein
MTAIDPDHVDHVYDVLHPATIEAELAAMQAIVTTFVALDKRAQRRVLDWARSRYESAELTTNILFDQLLDPLLKGVAAHKAATKQPSQRDRDLWEMIRSTKYWVDDEPESAS